MRAEFVEQPDPAARVAERDEVLAQQPDAHGRAVGLRQLPASRAGIQYRRIAVPIGVPGPTRVSRSLSPRDSMPDPPWRRRRRADQGSSRLFAAVYDQPDIGPLPSRKVLCNLA